MRRTNKRYKNKNNIKKRKTLKKRFSKKGGVLETCGVCGESFDIRNSYDLRYITHMRTHPKCKYCGDKRFLDVNALIEHLCDGKTVHPDMPNACKLANDIKYDDGSNLIDKLRNNVETEIGSLPELTKFYNKIEGKQKKELEKLEKLEKSKLAELKAETDRLKEVKRETARKEEEARKLKKIQKAKEEEEANRLAKEAIRERERVARETAAAKKLEQIKKEQQEKQQKQQEKLEVQAMNVQDKTSQQIEQQTRRELASMNAEDINVSKLKEQLIEATTVEQVEEIIDNASNINESNQSIRSKQKPINIEELIAEELHYLNSVNIFEFFKAISTLYPAMTTFNSNVSYINPYKNINYGILFIVGVINNKLDALGINLKLVLKGGKASQMILSENNIRKQNLIKSNDVDILLIQDGIYDYEFLLNFASQLGDIVQKFFQKFFNSKSKDIKISIIKPPNKMLDNKNIVKISYGYLDLEINPVTGLTYSGLSINPNLIPTDFDYTYIPLSDIDFKEVNVGNDFFSPENIVSSSSSWKTNNGYIFNLLYYHQDLNTFIAEKEYYMSIYSNIIQQIPDSKPGNPGCNCSLPNDDNNECKKICRYRDLMLEKFNKYIEPLRNLID